MALENDSIDLNEYLPFTNITDINKFCNNDDGQLQKRINSIQNRIYAVGDTSSPKDFVATVCDDLFDEMFQIEHKDPEKRHD